MFLINYCDYNARNADGDWIYRPNGSGDNLFLLILSPMRFYLNQQWETARPGACILYSPGVMQRYEAVRTFWNSYVHFHFPDDRIYRTQIPENTLFYPEDYDTSVNWALKRIHHEYLARQPYCEEMMSLYLEQMFIDLSRSVTAAQQYSEQGLFNTFRQARLQILTDCGRNWTIEEMCGLVSLGKSQFFNYYKQFFNTTPKADLLHARMDKAKNLLTSESMQVGQVAQLVGFTNIYHFSRYFKEVCGCAPTDYIRLHAASLQRNQAKELALVQQDPGKFSKY